MSAEHAQHAPSQPLACGGCDQDCSPDGVLLKVLLYDKATHGMSDQHGLRTKLVGGSMNVVYVVGNRARA